nr:MAG TPA: hypothetical protein [Caudoviricetes sp.]DAN98631.1 MAG TPA: hypothetical protein [Caudoviricetes sp.]
MVLIPKNILGTLFILVAPILEVLSPRISPYPYL